MASLVIYWRSGYNATIGSDQIMDGGIKMSRIGYFVLVLFLLLNASCGPQRPVLYPNERLKSVGQEAAGRDIDACMQLARESGADSNRTAKVAGNTAKAGVVGGATGAVIGAISGDAGIGAAIGAAGAGTAALTSSIFRSEEPDPIFRQFVETCLREKGYQTIGWK